jgi:hypothetical protein
MGMSKQEIATKLKNEEEILQAVRERLQELELREARLGFNTPPEVVTEIREYTKRAQRHEAEVERLRSLGAEDGLSLAEAEYRALLAKVWQTPNGRPIVIGTTQLEYDRLRLGILRERAQEFEQEIRVDLATETLIDLDLSTRKEETAHQYERIIRAFRLDHQVARRLLVATYATRTINEFIKEGKYIRLWLDKAEQGSFLLFLTDLRVIGEVELAVTRTTEILPHLRDLGRSDNVAANIVTAEGALSDAIHVFCHSSEATNNGIFPSEAVEAVGAAVDKAYTRASSFQALLNKAASGSEQVDQLNTASNAAHKAALTLRTAYNFLQKSQSPALALPLTACVDAVSLAIISSLDLMRQPR